MAYCVLKSIGAQGWQKDATKGGKRLSRGAVAHRLHTRFGWRRTLEAACPLSPMLSLLPFQNLSMTTWSSKMPEDGGHPLRIIHPWARPCAAGELLKAKAEAGVRVLLMLWDDKTSLNTPYLRNGLMGVHDEARTQPPPAELPLQPLQNAARPLSAGAQCAAA